MSEIKKLTIGQDELDLSKYTPNDGTLTIQQNGTTVDTFTANSSANKTVNIETIYSEDVSTTQAIDWTTILNKFHPVGSIYMSAALSTAAQVEAAIGGTWIAWGAGRVPVGVDTSQTEFDTVEETGGEKTHTLTTDEIPSHQHDIRVIGDSNGGGTTALNYGMNLGSYSSKPRLATLETGGGNAHNNLQPYITCYMYKRTA